MGKNHVMNSDDAKIIAIEKLRRSSLFSSMDEILPGLFLAGLSEARDSELLEMNKIMAVVPVHDFQRDYPMDPKIATLRIRLADIPQADASIHFPTVNSFIHSYRLNNENVLIHCVAGVSRSVSFVVAYIMSVTNLDYPEALAFVSSKRRNASPNFGFRMQLRKFYDKNIIEERQRLKDEFSGRFEHVFVELYKKDCLETNSFYSNKILRKN